MPTPIPNDKRFSNEEDPKVLVKAQKMMQRSRSSLVLMQAFFGVLLFKLKDVVDWNAGTAYTDGKVIGYNPNYIVSLTMDEVRAVHIHEVMHCAGGHHLRGVGKHHTKWNFACDYAINWIIDQLDGFSLMEGALNSPAFANKMAEWIYNQLPTPPEGSGSDQGGMGEVRQWTNKDGKKPTAGEIKHEQGQWNVAVNQAKAVARQAGKLPAGLDRWVNKLLKPKVDVKALLSQFLMDTLKGDFSWKLPNQRYMQTGFYLPSLQPSVGKLQRGAYIADTSGSITDDELKDTASIIWEIVTKWDMEIDVFSVDKKLHKPVITIDSFSDPTKDLKFKGGGGTSFVPAFDYIEEKGLDPVFAVYFTDGWCDEYPDKEPLYPVIWLLHADNDEFNPPFGIVARMVS
jgi:predicted metal-dependent peptidase